MKISSFSTDQPLFAKIRSFLSNPYVSLVVWFLPLLLAAGESSLMAHDEGLYARRARQMFETGNWLTPDGSAHHKTPGIYWLIAASYKVFGVSAASARFPSLIAGMLSVLLLYNIADRLIGRRLAWLAAAILSVSFLWLQYSRLGTPDVTTICLVLVGIWSLLKAEQQPKWRPLLGFVAGFSFAVGFLIRSFMVVLPAIALLPYLITQHKHHRHLTNPMLYLGGLVGSLPSLIWFWLSWQQYGSDGAARPLQFVWRLAADEREGNGLLFYLGDIAMKSFPWGILAILGGWLAWRWNDRRDRWLLVGAPASMLLILTLFPTRLSHYSLGIYPFLALLAAIALDWLGQAWLQPANPALKWARRSVWLLGAIALLLLIAGIVGRFALPALYVSWSTVAIVLGLGWLILPGFLLWKQRQARLPVMQKNWLAGWLMPLWVALFVAGLSGLLGDYNPEVRQFLQQPAVATILKQYPINFVDVGGKTGVLLNFYTPQRGAELDDDEPLPVGYAWIRENAAKKLTQPHRVVGSMKGWQLIEVTVTQ
ncbi:MAG TPA: glycosyltransferase family 39 protein [Leptolyngbyaceae cyanobacterium M33_DOE_097]|uniref:Phospholipid carrier-dependent glycosyltransferase n=1 Tax=Oscillatoriales cyanobacterium SpSt-418 TaxID=2282169 RepID=A0A7C3KFP1_9CYAN|nr:glycosyltransferase family 39 protein [Leptolyngbyaceae cyanobacterium M33_DOE_097]